jgi:hypothetical protein
MACDITLGDVTFSCDDIGIGGLKRVIIANKADLVSNTGSASTPFTPVSVANDVVTVNVDPDAAAGSGNDLFGLLNGLTTPEMIDIQFNLKDGFSVFSEVKTVSADGVVSSVPTISIEIPKMSEDHRNDLNNLAKPGAELVAFVETAAGTYHMVGYEYGLYASTVDGNSGTGRSEKNRYQITLTGEEDSLSYSLDSANWENLTDSVA